MNPKSDPLRYHVEFEERGLLLQGEQLLMRNLSLTRNLRSNLSLTRSLMIQVSCTMNVREHLLSPLTLLMVH